MGRSLPKIVVLVAIGAVVTAIYLVERRGPPPPPNVVYVNPNISTPSPAR
jgi:hypothetical protein